MRIFVGGIISTTCIRRGFLEELPFEGWLHSGCERMRLGGGAYPGGQAGMNKGPEVRNQAANSPF